ncbi:hypothetical protein LKD70_09170 [Ruminococcus sp. CLA-AA-H200]|uniref:DUF4046 domain-containing protein n=1 Tax=Ruminococcus turbiniformis TaxID=2881258 RepID=A0ABS8FX18_9FIRM|nr:hypothetical protein [Ruminococcus turbiniformis]MCC2254585.1 hypothetical protein [Ruminococcus turbiniformis]
MDTLYLNYENYLIGATNDIGMQNFFGAEPGGANQQRAVSCIKYALEEVLGWDMEECIQKFDSYILSLMKLERLADFIEYPDEVEPRDTRYILSLMYPKRVHLNLRQLVIEVYDRVLNHESHFPKEYFSGPNGFFRYCICLQYLITNYHPVESIDELYQFLMSNDGSRFLMEYRLKVPADHLEIDLLDCVHEITDHDENSSLYYGYYQFLRELGKANAAS